MQTAKQVLVPSIREGEGPRSQRVMKRGGYENGKMAPPGKYHRVWMGSEPRTHVKTHMWSNASAAVELLVGRGRWTFTALWPMDEREDGELGWEPGDGDEVAQKKHMLIYPLTW